MNDKERSSGKLDHSAFRLSDNDSIRALLEGPNFAHVATLMADGAPHVAPIWIDVEGSDARFVKEEKSVAMANLRRDPRVAISVSSAEDPYEETHVRGRVREIRPDSSEAVEWLHQAALAYTGSPYPEPLPPSPKLILVELTHGGFGHFTHVEHTPPGAALQLPR